jgi:hypothetical protein
MVASSSWIYPQNSEFTVVLSWYDNEQSNTHAGIKKKLDSATGKTSIHLFNGYCRLYFCLCVALLCWFSLFHYMFRPTWPSSGE